MQYCSLYTVLHFSGIPKQKHFLFYCCFITSVSYKTLLGVKHLSAHGVTCPQNDIKLTSKMCLTSLFKGLLNQKSLGCVEIRKKDFSMLYFHHIIESII